MRIVPVEAGGQSHDVLIGPLGPAPDGIVITDELVWSLHGGRFPDRDPIFVPHGEAAKTWPVLERLIEELARRNVKRDTPIVAFGGGSIGDVGGLAAALFKRGCPLVQVPTTLVAQVDSAIGGKVAIDAAGLKNIAGTFYLPKLVACDPALLATLDRRQLRAGYAELVKYGLIDDAAMVDWCEAHAGDLLDGDLDLLTDGIAKAVTAKARFVREDFHDQLDRRALLNFGHTFGHAVEVVAGFGPVLHGEAVAIGMALAFQLSVELGHCPARDADRAIGHLRSAGLATTLAEAGIAGRAAELAALMAKDKKADAGGLKLILTRGIGAAFVSRDVGPEQLEDFLSRAV
ncbi:MAG TPA: 3-dehydroquinate synthase [Sphingomicrobium sp.]